MPVAQSPKAPSPIAYLSEPYRAMAEHAGFLAALPALRLLHSGEGRGRHVLVIPGLMADDRSTAAMRRSLDLAGYQSHGWDLGRNIGPTREIIVGVVARLEELATREGGAVPVVGWSLGGLLARELGGLRPGLVDRIVTLGSPLSITDKRQSSASAMYDLFEPQHLSAYSFDQWRSRRQTPAQPITSIFSKSDGIVQWRASQVEPGPRAENVEVYGSHCGLGANAAAVHVVLDRLAAPLDDWKPFKPGSALAGWFPADRRVAA